MTQTLRRFAQIKSNPICGNLLYLRHLRLLSPVSRNAFVTAPEPFALTSI
jgi:hypothetical protein